MKTYRLEYTKITDKYNSDIEKLRMKYAKKTPSLLILETKIEDLIITVRLYNAFKSLQLKTLRDLTSLNFSEFLRGRNVGKKTVEEAEQLLIKHNLTFNATV